MFNINYISEDLQMSENVYNKMVGEEPWSPSLKNNNTLDHEIIEMACFTG